ncbi:MAG TPA: L,D-transpeptidase [Ktedonobacteraceae bacterium]|nr:L,D-transpeptidase [Ktedonobacteraceae bacterium]
MASLSRLRQRPGKAAFVMLAALLVMLLLSACGDPQTQQQATSSKAALDQSIANARSIGVPADMLQPILNQEAQLSQTNAPFGLFNGSSVNAYYTNLAQRYSLLKVQVSGLELQVTQELDYQATVDLSNFESALAQRQDQNFVEAKIFATQLTSDQNLLAKAQYPKDYLQISYNAKRSTQALHLMGPAYNALLSLQQVIRQLQASHLDVTGLKQQQQNDLQAFRNATKPEDYSSLIDQINTQLNETTVYSSQAIPYVGAYKLSELNADINLLKQYGQNYSTFQQHYNADKAALANAKSITDYLKFSSQIDSDLASIQMPLIEGQASYLLSQFHKEVTSWGNSHQYHDSYDGGSYNLDYEYDEQGIGSDADAALQYAQGTQSIDDFQSAIDLINNDMLHLKMMEADYSDKTPWNQVHATDIELMKHYNLMSGQVLVVSLIEQTLRLYDNGKLVRSFLITSGQYDKPSPPGFWNIFLRQSPTVFKSSEPKGSAFWYPDTKINYAMEYHDGGYFFHDSWWRVNYGPGTNFPHYDVGGDEQFAGNGSHGCINMQENDAAWLYANTSYGAAVLLY